jgi:tetratricopeptide (TPR) repeat protein
VVEAQPTSVDPHINLGIAFADHYESEAAIREFTEALRLAPYSAIAYYNRGRVSLDQRRYELAKPDLENACKLNPKLGDAFFLLAIVERALGSSTRSSVLVEEAIKLDPTNGRAYYLLGQDLEELGRKPEAIAAWEKASTLDPDRTEILLRLSRILQKSNPEQAKRYQQHLKQKLEQQQILSQAETLGNFALASAKAHDYVAAFEQLREAIALCGNCSVGSKLHKSLGLIQCQSGDIKAGRQELELALRQKPDDSETKQALAVLASIPDPAGTSQHN